MARVERLGVSIRRLYVVTRASNPFAIATYVMALASVTSAILLLELNPVLAVLVLAILWGWCEADGLCGRSHVCTITPLSLAASRRTLWMKAAGAYTTGGLITATGVGVAVGWVGEILPWDRVPVLRVTGVCLAFAAIALAARELGVLRFQLPQVHRQTHKGWGMEYGVVVGAAMWGAHIGLAFATVIQHGGIFILVALAAMEGPTVGAQLFAVYWIGRCLPIWFAGTLKPALRDGPELSRVLVANRAAYRHAAALGLLCGAIVILNLY